MYTKKLAYSIDLSTIDVISCEGWWSGAVKSNSTKAPTWAPTQKVGVESKKMHSNNPLLAHQL
jgi:hypothetical protein